MMQIIRQGSRRSSHSRHIVPVQAPRITWDRSRKNVTLTVRNIPDGKCEWDYWVHLSISDLREAMVCLAEKGIADCQDEISQEFSSQLDKLLKIMMCSVGVVSQGNTKGKTASDG